MSNVNSPGFTSNNGPQTASSGAGGKRPVGNGSAHAPEILQGVAQGVHESIDRFTERVTPHMQRLQEGVAGAGETLEERADQLREMSDEWMETLRCAVRDNPLAALGAALAVGMLVARLSR